MTDQASKSQESRTKASAPNNRFEAATFEHTHMVLRQRVLAILREPPLSLGAAIPGRREIRAVRASEYVY